VNTNFALKKLQNKTMEYRIDQLIVPATRKVVEEEEEAVNNVSGMMGELSSRAGDL
jgi:hypothetical protein